MQWTKKELLDVLEQYKDEDVLVGELWTKLDVEYQLAEISSNLDWENVSEEDVTNLDVESFWNDYVPAMDDNFEHSTSENNNDLYIALLDFLKPKVS
tara:strand:- start:1484 stop:1774 length:291 start_codon:yes stop_codon:yes gene_type:complete